MLKEGQVLAGRFAVESLAGTGGMGAVYRACDLKTKQPVALKILRVQQREPLSQADVDRFAREARVLAELRHPAIVGYVDHGIAEESTPYLAMEWVEGHDLAHRLRQSPLQLRETLILMRRVAEALSGAHERGIVHRDIKPANLLLRSGEVDRVVVLDFGIARRGHSQSQRMTGTGYLVGTPEYMAPEQARGEASLTPAVDVFALGCVWFECLTGRPPFQSEHIAAVLAKVLFEPAPALSTLRPGVPAEVEALIGRMLAKDPAQRCPDGRALLAELAVLDGVLAGTATVMVPMAGTLPAPMAVDVPEQRLVAVVLASPPVTVHAATLEASGAHAVRKDIDSLRVELAPLGADIQMLADGSLVVTLSPSRREATDLAILAARGALLIRERWPDALVALATGRAVVSERIPLGEAIERAGRLLTVAPAAGSGQAPLSNRILLDELTTDLLGSRFIVEKHSEGVGALIAESQADASRPLLGKPTPFLGREQELSLLDATLRASVEEQSAKAVIVRGGAGAGKSRLRHEFLRRLDAQGVEGSLLIARGDPLRAGSAYVLLGQALRRLCGVREQQAEASARLALRERLGRYLDAERAARVSAFLSEAAGYQVHSDDPLLRSARQEPAVMAEQIKQALITFLRAECEQRPVLLVIDDLQWCDSPTVQALNAAFHALEDLPFAVLGLARPEVDEIFPSLLGGRAVSIVLRPLSKRVCERLVQQIYGKQIAAADLSRIVEQCQGNPLFLEELMRTLADGRSDNLPATILAILQARIDNLPTVERRVLRAASVFGDAVPSAGVQRVTAASLDQVSFALGSLVQAELLLPPRAGGTASSTEYSWRSSVAREAAYSLLSDEERQRAHGVAAAFLVSIGEQNASVLAEHFRKGGDLAQAQEHYAKAASTAFRYAHLEEAIRMAERGLECQVPGAPSAQQLQTQGLLRGVLARAFGFRGDFPAALRSAEQALSLLPQQTARWYEVLGAALFSATLLEDNQALPTLLRLANQHPPGSQAGPPERAAFAQVAVSAMNVYVVIAAEDPARKLLQITQSVVEPIAAAEPLARGDLQFLHAYYVSLLRADPWLQAEQARRADASFQEAQNRRMSCFAQLILCDALSMLGDHEEATRGMRKVLALAEQTHEQLVVLWTVSYLTCALLAQPEPTKEAQAEARALADGLLRRPTLPRLMRGLLSAHFAHAERRDGSRRVALGRARESVELLRRTPAYLNHGYRELLACLAAENEVDEASRVAEAAMLYLRQRPGTCYWDLGLISRGADALERGHQLDAAGLARHELQSRMQEILSRAPDESERRRVEKAWQRMYAQTREV